MGTGGIGAIAASSYTAEDQDINNAELVYTEWETDLQMQIDNAEADHPGYDEIPLPMWAISGTTPLS